MLMTETLFSEAAPAGFVEPDKQPIQIGDAIQGCDPGPS